MVYNRPDRKGINPNLFLLILLPGLAGEQIPKKQDQTHQPEESSGKIFQPW
jgi:hypothetical protein